MNSRTLPNSNTRAPGHDNKLVDRKYLNGGKAVNKLSKNLLKIDESLKGSKITGNSNKIDNSNNSQTINSSGNSTNTNIMVRGKSNIINVYTANKTALENEIRLLKEIIKSKDEIIEMLKKNVSTKLESD